MQSDSVLYINCILCVVIGCRLGEIGEAALVRHEGRGSEGFLEHMFKHAAKDLFGLEVHEITYKTLRWDLPGSLSFMSGDDFHCVMCHSSLPVSIGTETSRKWPWSRTERLCCTLPLSTDSGTSRPSSTGWERDECRTIWWRCCLVQEVTLQPHIHSSWCHGDSLIM